MLLRWCFLVLSVPKLAIAFSKAYLRLRSSAIKDLNLPATVGLTRKEMRRMRQYFLGTTYLKVVFYSLNSKCNAHHEKYLFSNLSALASFFDDLVDARRQITEIVRPIDPITFGLQADNRGLARLLLENVYQRLPSLSISTFKGYMQRVFLSEMEGAEFDTHAGDLEPIERLTAEKGGSSVLLFRSLLQPSPATQEEKALEEFGCLIQLSDDIFDVWFDKKEGVTTLATKLIEDGRLGDLEACYERQWERTRRTFYDIPIQKWRIGMAIEILHMLVSITRACLIRYKRIEKMHGRLLIFDRKQMVTDMGKWGNQVQAVRLLLFLP